MRHNRLILVWDAAKLRGFGSRDLLVWHSAPNVRCGSKPVLAELAQRRRLSEVERTSKPRKRTLPLEGQLSGVERSYRRRGPNRRL